MQFGSNPCILLMAPKSSKRLQASEVPGLQHLPRRQLLELLRAIRNAPREAANITAGNMDHDLHEHFDAVRCEERLQYADKPGEFVWEFAEPTLLTQYVVSRRPLLASRYVDALQKYPCSADRPWRCVVGFDEFQPGDKFNFDRSKLVMCLYFTFAEIDGASQGAAWFCPVAVRATEIDSVVGGWSRALACFLHRFFLGDHGAQTVGIPFTYQDRDFVIFAKLSNLVSDGDGFRKAVGWRGAGSLRPSLVHGNVLKKDSDLFARRPGFVEIDCADPSLLHKTTTAEFQDSCDLVAEATHRYNHGGLGKPMLDNIIKTEAINYIPGGLSFDPRLRGHILWFAAITVDWVHTFLQEGVMNVDALLAIHAFEVDPNLIKVFLQDKPWNFPHAFQGKGQYLWKIFSATRLDDRGKVGKIRASASELLGLYSLLRHFLFTEVARPADLNANWLSFTACCDLLDYITDAKKKLVPMSHDMLCRKITTFMLAHVGCYGSQYVKPKHAWMWAVAERWLLDTDVWDAFIVERLHLRVKQIAAPLRSLHRLERTILSGVLNDQLCNLQTLHGACCLLGNSPFTLSSLPDTLFGDEMQVLGMLLRVDDVVFHGDNAGLLKACVLEDGVLYGVVELWQPIGVVTPHAKRWHSQTGDVRLIDACEMDQAYNIGPIYLANRK